MSSRQSLRQVSDCDEARADVFDYIKHSHNPSRRHSNLRYLSLMGFEAHVILDNDTADTLLRRTNLQRRRQR